MDEPKQHILPDSGLLGVQPPIIASLKPIRQHDEACKLQDVQPRLDLSSKTRLEYFPRITQTQATS